MALGKMIRGSCSSVFVLFLLVRLCPNAGVSAEDHQDPEYMSAIGDPGMRRDGLRVAIEAWNQCNEVGQENPGMGSPRAADCFDLDNFTEPPSVKLVHRVREVENKLGAATAPMGRLVARDADRFAALKEVYLGKKCQVHDGFSPWQFWMIMLKSGNMDTMAAACPENGKKSTPFPPDPRFPCFGKGCMNMPLIRHNYTTLTARGGNGSELGMRGGFYGTWDLSVMDSSRSGSNPNVTNGGASKGSEPKQDASYYSVVWEKKAVGAGSWVFHHELRTSTKYPWLMLYLRSDATTGFSGGYHYSTRGMSRIIPRSPDFKVRFTLDVKRGGGPKSQFYLMDMGGCWKNDGRPCDGDTTTDVTRYSEMIINPTVKSLCAPDELQYCPPYHTFPNGTRVRRTDAATFPYAAYHMYCSPGNGEHLEAPYNLCDAYSNPQPQEILQIKPHPVWGEYGYPTQKGEGWVGDPRTWELDVGRLSQSLFFYQDPGTVRAERFWPSIDLGTEIYMSPGDFVEWSVSDFDIIIPKGQWP